MKSDDNRIEAYRFGAMTVGGRTHRADLIIWLDRIAENWRRRRGHELCPEDLEAVLAAPPARLVVGTGYHGVVKVLESTRRTLEREGIELVAVPSEEAVAIWNRWLDEGRLDGVAAFHLTC